MTSERHPDANDTELAAFRDDFTQLLRDLQCRTATPGTARITVRYDRAPDEPSLILEHGQLSSERSTPEPALRPLRYGHGSLSISHVPQEPGEVVLFRPGTSTTRSILITLPAELTVLLGPFLTLSMPQHLLAGQRLTFLSDTDGPRGQRHRLTLISLNNGWTGVYDDATTLDLTLSRAQTGTLRRVCHAATRAYLHDLNAPHRQAVRAAPTDPV